ncbi:MAG: penicillin-binding protein activator [Lonepinella koalarum]|nr:penicillin-binding protein activator [Lonepinella koalarum]
MTILLQRTQFKKRLMTVLFPALLASCTLTGGQLNDSLKNDANANSDFYLNKAYQTQQLESQQTYKLLAARVLVTENKGYQAEALLNELKNLTPEQTLDKNLIQAHIYATKNENDQAGLLLKTINLAQLSLSQQARYYEVEARIAENRHDVIEAVAARSKMDAVLSDIQRKRENNDRTWALLRNANKGTIAGANAHNNVTLAGWLALARTYNDNVTQPTLLSQAIQQWKTAYPTHTAALLFPTELESIANFQQTRNTKVALLLPLSGEAQLIGQTVKSGFDDARGSSKEIQVEVIDTMITPVAQAVEKAKQNGAKAIVGPLLKGNVDVILSNPQSIQGLNVLALNATANARAIPQLCYYGLSPEDEAESAADKMWKDNIRKPVILVPQNDLGQRTATAFNVRWQRLAATDANIKFYNQTDDAIHLLQEISSEAAYIIATSQQLSEIKSVIDNAGIKLKLYSSSRSNNSNSTPEYRLQMNGIQFSDIPFFKETDSPQYKKIESKTNGDYSLMRLYAMGSDAWLLINQFNELRQVPGYSVSGLTGKLSAGPNCNVDRDMTWFEYQGGQIINLQN